MIELPKKIFGRNVEGGVERALAKKEEERLTAEREQEAARVNRLDNAIEAGKKLQEDLKDIVNRLGAKVAIMANQFPLPTIDWSKFLDGTTPYDKKKTEYYGMRNFVDILWDKSSGGKNVIKLSDISDILISKQACNPVVLVDLNAVYIVGTNNYLPGPKHSRCPYIRSRSISFQPVLSGQNAQPGLIPMEYEVKRVGWHTKVVEILMKRYLD
jgi:hypothetical protein